MRYINSHLTFGVAHLTCQRSNRRIRSLRRDDTSPQAPLLWPPDDGCQHDNWVQRTAGVVAWHHRHQLTSWPIKQGCTSRCQRHWISINPIRIGRCFIQHKAEGTSSHALCCRKSTSHFVVCYCTSLSLYLAVVHCRRQVTKHTIVFWLNVYRRIRNQESGYCLGLCRVWTVKKFTAADDCHLQSVHWAVIITEQMSEKLDNFRDW